MKSHNCLLNNYIFHFRKFLRHSNLTWQSYIIRTTSSEPDKITYHYRQTAINAILAILMSLYLKLMQIWNQYRHWSKYEQLQDLTYSVVAPSLLSNSFTVLFRHPTKMHWAFFRERNRFQWVFNGKKRIVIDKKSIGIYWTYCGRYRNS